MIVEANERRSFVMFFMTSGFSGPCRKSETSASVLVYKSMKTSAYSVSEPKRKRIEGEEGSPLTRFDESAIKQPHTVVNVL